MHLFSEMLLYKFTCSTDLILGANQFANKCAERRVTIASSHVIWMILKVSISRI